MTYASKFGTVLEGEKLGMLHPKQKYRYRVVFMGFGENQLNREMTQNVVSCTRPKGRHEKVPVHAYNSTAYIAGKHTWDPLTIVLRDDLNNSVISAVGSQYQKQFNHFEQTSAVAGINYKFTIEIHSLDGTNNDELESWVVEGCWIEAMSSPDGDNSSSESQTVELTISFDNATHVAGPNTNGGNTAGGNPFPNLPSPTGGSTIG